MKAPDLSPFVFENEFSAQFFNSAWRQFRKRNAYPTAITQNVEYLLDSVQASTMLSNSEFIIMLNQAASDQNTVQRGKDAYKRHKEAKRQETPDYQRPMREQTKEQVRNRQSNPAQRQTQTSAKPNKTSPTQTSPAKPNAPNKAIKQRATSQTVKQTAKSTGRQAAKNGQRTIKTAEQSSKVAIKTAKQSEKAARKAAEVAAKASAKAAKASAKAAKSAGSAVANSPENNSMWMALLYGIHVGDSDIVAVALSQIGNVGGEPYWSWYGFESRVAWCHCFVSWCADQCGYLEAGIIPNTAGCCTGVDWFKAKGQWVDGSVEPVPGLIIYFDWEPRDGYADHVGIVEKVENGYVYTVEGKRKTRRRVDNRKPQAVRFCFAACGLKIIWFCILVLRSRAAGIARLPDLRDPHCLPFS